MKKEKKVIVLSLGGSLIIPDEVGVNYLKKLKQVFLRHLEYIEGHPGNARLLFSDEIHFDDKKLRELLKNVVEERKQFIKEMVVEGQSQGVIKPNLDPEGIALMFIGLIQAKVLLWSLSGRETSLKQESKNLWDVFIRSIAN